MDSELPFEQFGQCFLSVLAVDTPVDVAGVKTLILVTISRRPKLNKVMERGGAYCVEEKSLLFRIHADHCTPRVLFGTAPMQLTCSSVVLRLTVPVVHCPCDTILPLQGDRGAFSPPAEPPIRQHWNGGAQEAADAGRRRETGGHGRGSGKPA